MLPLLMLACGPGGEAPRAEARSSAAPLVVYAVNDPLRYFAERIGGSRVDVHFPAPEGVDPAFWSPDRNTVAEYQAADLILLNGAGYAAWVGRASLRRSSLVDTSKALGDRLIPIEDLPVHSHGPDGEHSHGRLAFTTWLDPRLAILQARAVADALGRLRPEHESAFREALASLEADLGALDARLEAWATSSEGEPLLFSHPVYQYLIRRYGLDARSVHWEPDVVPSEAQWRELQDIVSSHSARRMLWEAEPLKETARRLRSLGIESVVFAPGGNRTGGADFLQLQRANVERLAAGSEASPGAS
jgi:zinc transport system substrate-binding protein